MKWLHRLPSITFVDSHDRIIGYGSKTEALSKGLIHRVVRVFILNSKGELLIQKRSRKVDVPNRWDQSAAGHVDKNENYKMAAQRECTEEIGLGFVSLREIGKYYSDESTGGKIRKRFNMIYVARYDGHIQYNKEEVSDIKWIMPTELERWMAEKPDDFTLGFLQSFRYFRTKVLE